MELYKATIAVVCSDVTWIASGQHPTNFCTQKFFIRSKWLDICSGSVKCFCFVTCTVTVENRMRFSLDVATKTMSRKAGLKMRSWESFLCSVAIAIQCSHVQVARSGLKNAKKAQVELSFLGNSTSWTVLRLNVPSMRLTTVLVLRLDQ